MGSHGVPFKTRAESLAKHRTSNPIKKQRSFAGSRNKATWRSLHQQLKSYEWCRLTCLNAHHSSVKIGKKKRLKALIGKRWITRFLHHLPQLASCFAGPIGNERVGADQPASIKSFFSGLSKVHAHKKIKVENTYNADEKGLMVGQAWKGRASGVGKQIHVKVSHPHNRECGSVTERRPRPRPLYIYLGKAHIMGKHPYQSGDPAVFAIWEHGWTALRISFL
ncbi:hypothetical protein FN846DRAFT_788344 [Sphaerosporella brunnea]|uniref:DDE-1 domain-containing protein n=1 Tax=Sphaerosporella brunnea TaxID=1250544 RepID=A0A5J5EDQ7_9PEZI|nr:hypothetical protein FN846DRAFT_788344 [Sphaerosporella brunnea]